MKVKFISIFAILLCLLLLCVCFAACKDDKVDPSAESSGETTGEETTEYVDPRTLDSEIEGKIALALNGTTKFAIVRPQNMTPAEESALDYIYAKIRANSGATPEIFEDDMRSGNKYDKDAFEILLGNTCFDETKQVISELNYGDYAVRVVGNKIVVCARIPSAMQIAGSEFAKYITRGATKNKSIFIDATLNVKAEAVPEANAAPIMANAGEPELYDTGDNCACFLYRNVNLTTFESYANTLKGAGYSLFEAHDVLNERNKYAQYYDDDYSVTLFYSSCDSQAKVFVEPRTATGLVSPAEQSYTAVANYAPKMLQIGIGDPVANNGGTIVNGVYEVTKENYSLGENAYSGMCYIFWLEDGRFIVYDGGHKTGAYDRQNARRIYEKMKEISGSGDITVAAWLVTHGHSDHFDALVEFEAMGLADKINIEKLIVNLPSKSQIASDDEGGSAGNFEGYRSTVSNLRKDGTEVIKAHPGQIFRFANVELQILFTHDMRVDEMIDSFNNTSIVSRLVIEQNDATVATVMITGDAYTQATDEMLAAYGDDLKSDVLQVPHHGYYRGANGARQDAFYSMVNPKFVVWPCGEERTYDTTHVNDSDADSKFHGHTRVLAQNAQKRQNKWILDNLDGWEVDTANNKVVNTAAGKNTGYISEGDNEIFFAFFDTVTFTFGVTNGDNVNDIHYERVKNITYTGNIT